MPTRPYFRDLDISDWRKLGYSLNEYLDPEEQIESLDEWAISMSGSPEPDTRTASLVIGRHTYYTSEFDVGHSGLRPLHQVIAFAFSAFLGSRPVWVELSDKAYLGIHAEDQAGRPLPILIEDACVEAILLGSFCDSIEVIDELFCRVLWGDIRDWSRYRRARRLREMSPELLPSDAPSEVQVIWRSLAKYKSSSRRSIGFESFGLYGIAMIYLGKWDLVCAHLENWLAVCQEFEARDQR